jgi:hypothetical protein
VARRRRESHRTEVVVGPAGARAHLIISIDVIDWDPAPPSTKGHGAWHDDLSAEVAVLRPWLRPAADLDLESLADSPTSAAIVIDRFALRLHLDADTSAGEATVTHDGEAFHDAAVEHGVAVHVLAGVDPRRSSSDERLATARRGGAVGALIPAFAVQSI